MGENDIRTDKRISELLMFSFGTYNYIGQSLIQFLCNFGVGHK